MSIQYQYLSKGEFPRWINCTREEVPQAHIEGFITRELYEHLTPRWIVNDKGELGILINDHAFFMYKGGPGTATAYRPVKKREFGESGPLSVVALAAPATGPGTEWLPIPNLECEYPIYYLAHPVFGRRQVTKEQYVAEERRAGFVPEASLPRNLHGEPVTNNFFCPASGITGHIVN